MSRRTLSGAMKSALLGSARQAAAQSGPSHAVAQAAVPVRPTITFRDLPEYKDFELQKSVSGFLGIKNPFFRSHEGCAGATSVIEGRECINFASYNYLGLNGHPDVREAAKQAIDTYGVSASASRVVAGERDIHRVLEKCIADFLGVDDAVAFVSGHATNIALIGQLLRPRSDLLLHDAFIHNSVMVGAKLSGCARRAFPHNDLDALETMLMEQAGSFERVLICVEGLYSMDGDTPDLARLVELKKRFNVWLMVDEAHSLGTMGGTGRGIAEAQGINPHDVDIWMGTLSKTLSGCGGYVAGDAALIEFLKLTAPGFVYSVGMPPAIAAAAIAAFGVLEREPERVTKLNANSRYFIETAAKAGLDTGTSQGYAIVPVMVGDSVRAVALASRLLDKGINALPIIYPAVPEKSARLRFFLTSEHTHTHMDTAIHTTACELAALQKANFGIKAAAVVARATRRKSVPAL
jgi:8-amino-7-oxononanoate synthase